VFFELLVVGNFVGGGLSSLSDNVVFGRVCFFVAQAVYICGIAILARGLTREGQKTLVKMGGTEDYIQSLRLS
jgi:hypothetical protein